MEVLGSTFELAEDKAQLAPPGGERSKVAW